MGEKKNIEPKNNNEEFHGYQEWYTNDDELWLRCHFKHGLEIGYVEYNAHLLELGDDGTLVEFYIR